MSKKERKKKKKKKKKMWLKEEGFKYLINDWWYSYEIRGIGSYVLKEKLKALKA